MAKKRVFIISHSHWDREWYMGYEHHHMRLISLMDDLFDLFEHDPQFNSFHLDGQTIILDDYLKVRPEKRDALAHWIKAGKLRIGPFYILQDDFLISPEANVRNTQYGLQQASQWGQPVPLGYFPDTFGNMGQTAQMMQLAGLDTVAFGRGVTPTGLNNQVGGGDFDSTYSEMWWQGPDHSQVLGILFANWYSNGNEIPVEPTAAKKYWDQKLADAERFAATPDLLFMNGVDHQPVQMNLTSAIQTAQALYPDYEFIHSNFADYLTALKHDLPKDLSTIKGELTSQATNGWYTLANTASSRIYLKQANTLTERLLEDQVEPMLWLSDTATAANQDRLDYAWKLLLQNHPHDSICGCSIDPVHERMQTRFAAAQQVGDNLKSQALKNFVEQIDTSMFADDAHPFVLLNTSGASKTQRVTVEVELKRALFKTGRPQALYDQLTAEIPTLPEMHVITATGEPVNAVVSNPHVRFNYDLPERHFRVPYMGLYVDVEVAVPLAAFSWETLAVVAGKVDVLPTLMTSPLSVTLAEDHQVEIVNSKTQQVMRLDFEDTGDIGNEYIYRQAQGDTPITAKDATIAEVHTQNTLNGQQLQFDLTWSLPIQAEAKLQYEQQAVIDVVDRTSRRGGQTLKQTLHITLNWGTDQQVVVQVQGDNQVRDHRLRAVLSTGMQTNTHQAESIFEVVTRANQVGPNWQNPTNPQHQQAFVALHDAHSGVVVGNFGLNEYEVGATGEFVALTLLRCVGEMGDWGYFETPKAQCLGPFTASFSVAMTDGSPAEQLQAMQQARAAQVPIMTQTTAVHSGVKPAQATYLTVDNPAFAVTATLQTSSGVQVRGYNLTASAQPLTVRLFDQQPSECLDLVSMPLAAMSTTTLAPAEIKTLKFDLMGGH